MRTRMRTRIGSRRTLETAAIVAALIVLAPAPGAAPARLEAAAGCPPTRADMLGPFYEPGAPVRSQVGRGHVLTGVVQSARDCRALAGARIEFWLAGPSGEYGDAWRATVAADAQGRYRFESHVPPPYTGRPPHIHIRVTAGGHRVLVTQYYPPARSTEGRFDLVLEPAP